MQAKGGHWHGPWTAIVPRKQRAVRVMLVSNLLFTSLCHITYNRLMPACCTLPIWFPVLCFHLRLLLKWIERALPVTSLLAMCSSLSQVKSIICHSSCQVRSWENFNFPCCGDSARGLMSITQSLKQELTRTWSKLRSLRQHYLTSEVLHLS